MDAPELYLTSFRYPENTCGRYAYCRNGESNMYKQAPGPTVPHTLSVGRRILPFSTQDDYYVYDKPRCLYHSEDEIVQKVR